jgi:hypothetical protein
LTQSVFGVRKSPCAFRFESVIQVLKFKAVQEYRSPKSLAAQRRNMNFKTKIITGSEK